MNTVAPRLASLAFAFAGVWLWIGALAQPAAASEAASAIAPPAVRLGEALSCRILSPQFQANGRARITPEDIHFLGGAKLRSLVGAPCPHRSQPIDV
ncbi:MAG TPA: hypothetical protein VN715_10550 [Roseiarcus sp.]|nr:hypothetical protein [Roseiarcus sp.]